MVKSAITDLKTNRSAQVVDGTEPNALVVATRPLKTYDTALRFFTNPEYGSSLNQDASAGGVPELVHDGLDNIYWTATNITGTTITFNSANQNHTSGGTQSIYMDGATVGTVFQIDRGTNIDLSNYVSLSLWVYIDRGWGLDDSIVVYGWDTSTNMQVGVQVDLKNYIVIDDNDVWQQAIIPLSTLELDDETADSIRFQVTVDTGTPIRVYLDDIQFEQTGTPITFSIEPGKGTWLNINRFMFTFADEYGSVLADSTAPRIPYNSFFALAELSTGIIYQRIQGGEIITSTNIRKVFDIMSFSNAMISGYGSDGTNSWASISVNFPTGLILKAEDKDRLTMTISEDLSGLLELKISAGGFIEDRSIEY